MTSGEGGATLSERRARGEATYEKLFGARDPAVAEHEPELLEILRGFIFGDIFHTGDLDDQTRELITVTVLTCLNALPQLAAHTSAALGVGVPPVAVREALYQQAPFIGFPRVLDAVSTVNQVFTDRGVALPLPAQGTVTEVERYESGLAIQGPLYGDAVKAL